MTISYVGQGGAVAVSTTAAPAYPGSLATNDKLILSVTSDGSSIGNAGAGWTEVGSMVLASGIRARQWERDYDGTTPAVSISCTGGTKGESHIAAFRSSTGNAMTAAGGGIASDSNTTTTAFVATDGSVTSEVGDWLVASWGILAPSGSYSANATSIAVTQVGATITTTARFGGRTGTNTIAYGLASGEVTSGGTGDCGMTATTVGANAGGVAPVVLLKESTTSPVTNSWSTTWNARQAITKTVATTWDVNVVAGNNPPTISADKFNAQAGEVVTLTVADSDGTIASVVVSGVTPAPAVSGSGGTRTFVVPLVTTDTVLTVTATDDDGATDDVTVTALAAPYRVYHNGAWRACYLKVAVSGSNHYGGYLVGY